MPYAAGTARTSESSVLIDAVVMLLMNEATTPSRLSADE